MLKSEWPIRCGKVLIYGLERMVLPTFLILRILAVVAIEFPVGCVELPQSRAQELRFYRLAYDRDPIVGRGIDLHTEIPMNKINLDRPKCSSEAFGDYIYDFYRDSVTNSRLFETLLHASREYWNIGEAFLF